MASTFLRFVRTGLHSVATLGRAMSAIGAFAALGGLVGLGGLGGLGAFAGFGAVAYADPVKTVRYIDDGYEVILNTKGDGVDADTPFAIASVGKMMTATLVLRLAERDLLSLDDSVAQWVDGEIVEGLDALDRVTIRHLLTMRSGIPDYLDDGFASAFDRPNGFDAVSYVFGEGSNFRPGSRFEYSNTNYVLLQLIMERATGQPYRQLMARHIFTPAKMDGAIVFGHAPLPQNFPNGHEDGEHHRAYYRNPGLGDGGVIVSARGLAAFMGALLDDASLLDAESLSAMLTPIGGSGYGMGIEIDGHIVGHSGGDLGFSSDARYNLQTENLTIVLTSDADSFADTDWAYDMASD